MRVGIRVAGLPVTALRQLRCDKSWAAIGDAVAAGRWLREEGARLSDELYELIGRPEASPVKPRAVALRRALFTGRRLPARLWNPEIRAVLPPELAARVDAWDRRYRERDAIIADLPRLTAEELDGVTRLLRETLRATVFQYGLVTGSPDLFEELTKWIDGPQGATPSRQTLLRLVKYLLRVVAKTSPYSTFTISGMTVSAPTGQAVRPTGDFDWASVVELNMWLVRRLADLAARHPALRSTQVLRVNPSLAEDGEFWTFLAGTPQAALVRLRRTPTLEESVRLVTEHLGTTFADLCRRLREIDPSLPEQEVTRYVAKLAATGVLNALPPYAEQDGDHLDTLACRLGDAPETAFLAEQVRALHTDLTGYAALTDPAERSERCRRITDRLGRLLAAAGRLRDADDEPAPDAAQPLPRKNLFHENAFFVSPVAEVGVDAWRPVLDDLQALRPVLGMFDPARPARRAVTRIFTGAYGAGGEAPWHEFYQHLQRLIAGGRHARSGDIDGEALRALCQGPAAVPPETWRALPYAGEQSELTDSVGKAIRYRPADPDGVVRIAPAEIEALTRPYGQSIAEPLTCYVQLLDPDRPPEVVLNTVSVGFGRVHTRLARMLRLAGATGYAEPPLAEETLDRALPVESLASFDSNLNLRIPATRYELDHPLAAPERAGPYRIPLNDLVVRHDPATDTLTLHSRRLGRRLRPTHGGLMAEMWLPRPIRHLIEIFGAPPTLMHASLPLFLPREHDPRRAGGVRVLPRLQVGRIVLARRCWAFPAREMPIRAKGESDAAYWLRLAEWLTEHALPERFYVRVVSASDAVWRPDLKSRKPMYVDAAAWCSVALLERAIGDPDDLVVVTEALPDPEDAPRYGGDGHVTEFTVEVDALADGRADEGADAHGGAGADGWADARVDAGPDARGDAGPDSRLDVGAGAGGAP
ncbi:lantibiotic dehydratase [Thermopolyspora sp. NPDC052614]|uniref:lantibiotic dehydratase n=1 Tax=Thermopolyspora sp. NPDC052614 TaxID=3155682 RepID=UPI003447164C